jgi:pimeloyl-ACP methyl ester carboxylesterase
MRSNQAIALIYFVHCNSRSPLRRAIHHKFSPHLIDPPQHDRMRNTILAIVLTLPVALTAQSSFQVKVTGHGQPQGQAMILIPGLASSGETFDSTVARYKDRYECHVLTLAGFAGVPAIPSNGTPMLQRVRDELAAYIRDRKLMKPLIVGHSLGGYVALDLASKYPDLPGKLIIVDSYPSLATIYRPEVTPEQAKTEAATFRKYMTGPGSQEAAAAQIRMMVTPDADYERILKWSRASDSSAVADAMVEMYVTDLRESVAAIRSPSLVLMTWIAYKEYTDRKTFEGNLAREYAKLKGADIRITDTSRHFIMYDEPQWFFTQIDGFLK